MMQIGGVPRVRFANIPTPFQEAKNLTEEIGGPRIFIKRDDLTGLAFGGNKTRILEFVMGDAVAKKADVILAYAGWHSNWCSQVATAAKKLGMDVILFKEAAEDGYDPEEYDGNQLLHFLLGADIRAFSSRDKVVKAKEEAFKALKDEGRKPYDANESPYTCVGYVNCIMETVYQANKMGVKIDYIIHASGSGMTQSGLVLGSLALNSHIKVLGVNITPTEDLQEKVAKRVNDGAELLGLNIRVSERDILINNDYLTGGYGIIDKKVVEAIELLARTEGIFVDPVYSAKALAGLIDLSKKGYFSKDDVTVFLHTGGIAGIFPYKGTIKALAQSKTPPWTKPRGLLHKH